MNYPKIRRNSPSKPEIKFKEHLDGFQGFDIKRKKMRIGELINMSSTPSNNFGRNIIFNCPFPLIKIASNRRNTNKSPELINTLLKSNKDKLSQTVKNMMKYNDFNLAKERINRESKNIVLREFTFNKPSEKSVQDTQRTLSLNHSDKGIQTYKVKEREDTFKLTSLNMIIPNEYDDEQKTDRDRNWNQVNDRLYTHRCIQSNRDLMLRRKLKDNNYIINGYKIKKKDHVMDKIYMDATLLKFSKQLRCII